MMVPQAQEQEQQEQQTSIHRYSRRSSAQAGEPLSEVDVQGEAEAAGLLAQITENEGASLATFFLFAIGFVALTLPLGIAFTSMSRRMAVKR